MPYAILPEDESVEAAMRRIARAEAERALAAVQGGGDLGRRVHEMRKVVKKLRGLLRLLRPVFPDAKAENAVLREAGRSLSDLRDADVQLATARSFSAGLDETRRAVLLVPFREAVRHHGSRAGESKLPAFADAMAALRDRSESWTLKEDGWDAIEPGLVMTWESARAAMKRARRRPRPDRIHEWRKRAKDHWYQARLLQPIWPKMMKPHVAAADELGKLLGEVNDLAVLRDRLEAAPLDPALRYEARDLADLRHAELMARALPLGQRLFAGKGQALSSRWKGWWEMRDSPG